MEGRPRSAILSCATSGGWLGAEHRGDPGPGTRDPGGSFPCLASGVRRSSGAQDLLPQRGCSRPQPRPPALTGWGGGWSSRNLRSCLPVRAHQQGRGLGAVFLWTGKQASDEGQGPGLGHTRGSQAWRPREGCRDTVLRDGGRFRWAGQGTWGPASGTEHLAGAGRDSRGGAVSPEGGTWWLGG